eukprot:5303471-Alexandrium_andersonii.AAC.1
MSWQVLCFHGLCLEPCMCGDHLAVRVAECLCIESCVPIAGQVVQGDHRWHRHGADAHPVRRGRGVRRGPAPRRGVVQDRLQGAGVVVQPDPP